MSKAVHPPTGRDYRIFIGAFPEGELAEQIQDLRVQYDRKTAQITAPHVTLAGTYWRNGPATAENEDETITRLISLSTKIPSFDLVLGGIYIFPPEQSPVIYLGVEQTPDLLSTRQTLLKVLGSDGHRHFAPHMTLAMRLKGSAVDSMLADLHGSEWDIQRWIVPIIKLHLMQRGSVDFAWRSICQFDLLH